MSSSHKEFLKSCGHVAFYGLKRNGKGFGASLLKGLRDYRSDIQISVIHPEGTTIDGIKTVRSVQDLSLTCDSAIVVLNPGNVRAAIDDIADANIRKVWLVLEAATPANEEYAEDRGLEVVSGCPFLFMENVGFPHNIHQFFAKLFGQLKD